MSLDDLALFGGPAAITEPLPPYRSIGPGERAAVAEVLDSGCLSAFYGSPGEEFWGGPKVRALEAAWAERFGVSHAVSVNSATSGLFAAVGAARVGPGDEVIVPPWTMSATVMAPLVYGAIPVFADIEPDTYCLDPARVAEAVSERTRAIIAVNLFGHPARLAELRTLAERQDLILIEDNAQGPLASEHGRAAGTIGHIGVFSLNYHKHIHTGEGGVCVTDDRDLFHRLALIRNHAENAAPWLGVDDLVNMVGFNYRLSELAAAIGLAQLAEAETHVARREAVARALNAVAAGRPGVIPPTTRDGCRHNHYVWLLRVDPAVAGVSRATLSRALAAEGFPHGVGYVPPLYRLPLFQRRMALGREGFPFTLTGRTYPASGLCPVTERLHEHEALVFEPCAVDGSPQTTERLAEALGKVLDRLPRLAEAEAAGRIPQAAP